MRCQAPPLLVDTGPLPLPPLPDVCPCKLPLCRSSVLSPVSPPWEASLLEHHQMQEQQGGSSQQDEGGCAQAPRAGGEVTVQSDGKVVPGPQAALL